MTYEQLIQCFSNDENLKINKNECSDSHFGSFIFELEYKNALPVRIINDRGLIEMYLLSPGIFSKTELPLEYAVDFLKGNKAVKEQYIFENIEHAYTYFVNSYKALDKIIDDKSLKIITKQWKKGNKQ
ncbi:MAG: hypothetical protein IJL87_03550 [Clostridia bacterium]|nr:hypothetical protein [Clostridia bacterium]